MTQFYCKYAHTHSTSICDENRTCLTFTASVTHFLWSISQCRLHLTLRKNFCKNNNYVVLAEVWSPGSGNKEYPNLFWKRRTY